MEIKATTTYNYEIVKDYLQFNLVKGKNYKRNRWLLVVSILLALGIIAYFDYYTGEIDFSNMDIILVALLVIRFFLFHLFPPIIFKFSKKFNNLKQHYICKDNEFFVSSNSPKYSDNSVMKYSMLYKVYETDKYFFFYIQSQQAYILEKKEILNGTVEEIRDAVSRCIPEKSYIICK